MYDAVQGSEVLTTLQQLLYDLTRHQAAIEASLVYTGGTHTFDDVAAMILTGRVRFWPCEHSFLITEVTEFPQQKHYHVWLGGGEGAIDELISMHQLVQQAAREAGCCKLTINGRMGWAQALKPHGWVPSYVALSLDI